jgi:putative flavoprotein involved in K+ transport
MARQLGGTDDELLDVVVIGGSQAGLAMAWHLARQHLRFVVLEAGPEPGHTWRSRWDSLTLFTPAQYAALPGMPFPGPPDTYPTKEQVAGYLDAYAAEFNLPVRLNARVTALILTAEGFEAGPMMVSSAPARWSWRPARSRRPMCRRLPSGSTAR